MGEWDRKKLLSISYAVRQCQSTHAVTFRVRQRLASVIDHANIASRHIDTSTDHVNRVKTQLCAVCRGEALYECDVVEGWSENCALLSANKS